MWACTTGAMGAALASKIGVRVASGAALASTTGLAEIEKVRYEIYQHNTQSKGV